MKSTKVLVLGISGMLGSALFRTLSQSPGIETWGTLRGEGGKRYFHPDFSQRIISGVDALNHDALIGLFGELKPQVVINCVGLIKQVLGVNDPLTVLPINSLLPNRLARLCEVSGSRLIHISTDCVFSGRRGHYLESDVPDAEDLYGRSKLLGEIDGMGHVTTLRTSIIGHELNSCHSLIDWFLATRGSVKGYANAYFSGLPTVELAEIIRDYVISSPISGLFHVSADRIDKFSLLQLVAQAYEKRVEIIRDEEVKIDRSLDSARFRTVTGYTPRSWPDLILKMHASR